ncbi:MAG: CorA family divalent cation transporter [Flammeovirgaceae bacterium]
MITKIFNNPEENFEWLDVINPSQEDFDLLTEQYQLHPAAVKDCLSPLHLPKCEQIGHALFIILRYRDEAAGKEADDLRKLTNKVAVFVSEEFFITIHRRSEPFLEGLKDKWRNYQQVNDPTLRHLFNDFVHTIIYTFDTAMQEDTEQLDDYEKRIFEGEKGADIIRDLYIVKRRSSIFKRILFLTKGTLMEIQKYDNSEDPFSQDLSDSCETLFFFADGLHENVNNLLNLHLSLASHRTNEVMGVLTIFSVFFLPLTFIVGLYGMNFKYMPELEFELGYPIAIMIMLVITVLAYLWFKRKGWL